ncbi:hypothetical protein [Stakelama saccharophila]|uniref:Uncharacterized protein n=1 Tax=Stakelama saccharophila TaxID=3075605 RepID=A0ABZ0BBB0_9SPHN|nr:hypothetical protein [Stakelama sp. W311]WNO54555.1 hypothetical protein RPR59_04680 [Stakelama sp. W311]
MSDPTDNEITAAVRESNSSRVGAASTADPGKRRNWPLAGIGIGIGSAALAAAAIYASKWRRER